MAVLSYLEIVLAANSAAFNQSIADARTQTVAAFSDMREYANNMGPAVGASFATAAAATTALVVEQVALANELQHTANVANSSVQEIQKYTFGAKKMGIEQDALGAIFQDTSDKIGDFLSTGGGGMADFFENVAPQIGVTAEQFRELSGPQALQLYYDTLDKANLSQNEMTFYLEAMASDATTLIPLLANGGEGFDVWAKAAANAGAVMDDETIVATQKLQATTDLLELSVDGAKTQFVKGFIPVLADVATKLTGTETASDAAYLAGQNLAIGFKGVAKVGIGVAATFDAVGSSIGGVAAIIGTLMQGVDVWDGGIEIAIKMARNLKAAGEMNRMVDQDIRDSLSSYADLLKGVDELGSGIGNSTVNALIEQKKRLAEINQELGKTGQQDQEQQEAAKKAAEERTKADKSALKAAKELGAAYVSNTALSGLKLKANEAIAGGKVRGYTAEFAEITQSLLGSNLKYFSALNDTYHAGSNSKHASGQAFDVVLKNANQAASAAAIIKKAAAQYGYSVKVLNEYAKPSKNATGGHLHVSVTGQKATKDGGADIQYIKQQNNVLAQEQQRAASEQARLLDQQAKDRLAIRLEYADEATRIETQLQLKLDKIKAAGFNADEAKAFSDDAKQRAAIELANYQDTQARKLAVFGNFARSERDIVIQNAAEQATTVLRDLEFSDTARQQALDFIKQKAVYELDQLDLNHAQQMQYAQQSQQTDIERITNQYALERREIQLTIKMDEDLRKAKIDALNQAEQLALDERRYAFESELRQLTNIGQSDLAALRQSYADHRRVLDQRTDISDAQKSDLRNAMAGAQIYDTNQLQKSARDSYNAQVAESNGTSASYGLAQQHQARLDVIKSALDAEVIAVEQAEQAKYAARLEFETAATQLSLSQAESTASNLAASFKTMFGEQNAAYQIMFAAQQSFVLASAGLNMYDAWSDAMAEGATLTQKLASAATIATEFGRIIGAASAITLELPGYQSGGYTGTGGLSDVAGLVHKEEFVANAPTTRKYRPELEAMHNGTYERLTNTGNNINVNVSVTMEGKSSVDSNSAYGKQIGEGLAAAIITHVQKMTQPNGFLDRQYVKR